MSRLARNIVYNAAGQIAIAGLTLVAVHYLFTHLGADAFGVVSIGLLWNALITSALELGLASVSIREIARHRTTDEAYVVGLIRTSSTLYWGLCAVLGVVVFLATPAVVHSWLHTSPWDSDQAVASLRILGISGLLGLPRTLYNSVLRGLEEMGAANAIEVAARVVQSAGILALVVTGGGLVAVSVLLSVVYGLVLVAYVAVIGRWLPLRSVLPGWDWRILRRNAGFAAGTATISVTAVAQIQADKVVLSRTLLVADVGFYNVGASLLSRVQLLILAIAEAGLPSLTRAQGDPAVLRSRYEKLQDLVVHGSLPAFALTALALGPILSATFGDAVSAKLALPMGLLALGFYLNATMTVPYVLSVAMGRSGLAARSNALSMVTVLPLAVGGIVEFGLVGAGATWLLFDLWGFVYLVPRLAQECLGTTGRAWLKSLTRAVPGTTLYVGAWLVVVFRFGATPVATVLVGAAATSVYSLLAYRAVGVELRGLIVARCDAIIGTVRSRLAAGRAG